MNKIIESAKFVVDQSKFVHLNPEGIKEFASNFDHSNVTHWLHASPLDLSSLSMEERLSFLLVFNSVSFSYWGDPKWTVEYENKQYDGAWGMIVCIKRALAEGIPILDAGYRKEMSREQFAHILRGNVEIPLLEERYQITKEVANVLVSKYESDFANLARKAEGDALKLLGLLIENFSSFDDVSHYEGKEVFFYKRTQLLVSDISELCSDYVNNADVITACADYKLPQALRKFNVLTYEKDLADKIDNKIEIAHGGEEEIEIRAATIWAIELIKEQVKQRLPSINSMAINDHIWLYTQTKYPDDKPYHLTRTTCY